MSMKRRPVTLIVMDAGPLISLACADRLDLLQAFGRPVLVADVVRQECTRKRGAPGEERLSQWFDTGANQYKELKTPFLQVFKDALERVDSGEDLDATSGLGDAAISWVIKNLPRLKSVDGLSLKIGPDEIALVLTEDGPYGDGPVLMRRQAHVLSTRQWLKALERLSMIPSYENIISEIEAAGRRTSRYMADRPAILGKGVESDWKDATEKVVSELLSDSDRPSDDGAVVGNSGPTNC